MADMARKVGARINELREERKLKDPRWTQDYLARQVEEHLNGTQMSRYERGQAMPGEKRLERIAAVLDTTVADLYAGPMSEREEPESDDLMGSLKEAEARPMKELQRQIDELGEKLDSLMEAVEEALAARSARLSSSDADVEQPTGKQRTR